MNLLLKKRFNPKKLILPILFISILWTTYTFATTFNTRNYSEAEIKYFAKYKVQDGDTLWLIATKLVPNQDPRETIYEIEQENNITALIRPGMVIKVPLEVE